MRIAYLANIRFPSERAHTAQISHMCECFTKKGVEVDLFANQRAVLPVEERESIIGFKPNFSIHYIGPKRIYPNIKISFYIGELFFALSFLKGHSRNAYDYFISRSEYITWLLSFFISRDKLLWESHDGRLNAISKRIMKSGVKTIVTSKGQYDLFQRCAKRIVIAPNAIDDIFFNGLISKEVACEKLGLHPSKRYTMYIGGLDEWKGPDTFMQASEHESSSQFIVIGGKAEEIELMKNKYPKILFLGAKPYSDLVYNQQAADVLVVPNTAKNEMSKNFTSPLKLFAHISSGVPLVATDIPSITNVVNSPDITLCQPDDPLQMATKITDVYRNYSEKKKYAEALRNKTAGNTWSKRAETLIQFMQT